MKILNQNGTLNYRVKHLISLLTSGYYRDNKSYLVESTKRGVYRANHNNLLELLDDLKIAYKEGNDAPRGGAGGDYIEFNLKYLLDQINTIKNESKQ